MKREKNSGKREAAARFRFILFAAFMLVGFLVSSNSHASGSKLPTTTDGTIISDTGEQTADQGGSAQTPSTPSTPTSPTSPTTPTTGGGTTISDEYAHIDPGKIVPKTRLEKALKYYHANKSRLGNTEVIVVIDFSQHSSKERFYLIDMDSGRVETYATAHGKGSDPDHDGYATIFSNVSGSNASSQGIYVTAETYYGSNGYSLKLDGKSPTNSNARSRAIVVHPADYVVSGQKAGRSWGCPALETRENAQVIDRIKGGAVMYAE